MKAGINVGINNTMKHPDISTAPTGEILPLVLASSSPYRKKQLESLCIPFLTKSANITENQHVNEDLKEMAGRLSKEKARALAKAYSEHLIIGSDQVATLSNNGDSILRKPGDFNRAFQQLRQASGNTVLFHCGLSLLNSKTGRCQQIVETVKVDFRQLSDTQIENYLTIEQPYDCAGSFKSEGLGICLIEKIECRDFNALIGLPLMALVDMLANENMTIPAITLDKAREQDL